MNEENNSSFRSFFLGSIAKKLILAFGILIIMLVFFTLFTYRLSNQISQDSNALRNVEAPLEVMVQQVIGFDALLTGSAYAALLHAEQGEFKDISEHKLTYDIIGSNMDNLLKFEAPILINQSKRSQQDKYLVFSYLKDLDIINLKLVDLEIEAFNALQKNDTVKARSLIVSDIYADYKNQLADLYQKWDSKEKETSEFYRQRVLESTVRIKIYILGLGVIFILLSIIVPFLFSRPIINSLRRIKEATEQISQGNYSVRVDVHSEDEIQALGTAFNNTAQKLEKLEEERKQIDKAKTEFLSITSHELRSPMTPMKAQLQMLEGDFFGKLKREQKEAVNVVLRNTERLDKIIVDFLEISRIEAARLKFNFIKTDLTEYLKRLKEEMNAFLPEKNIVLEFNVSVLPRIEIDPDRAMQVLRNLINNAKKFTSPGGKIVVDVSHKGDFILFSVRDNGIGIKKSAQARLFEPFYQVDNMYQHQSGGTGLGLAICKGIVESQNGRIWFESEEGKGTVFHFTLPVKPVREIRPIKILFSAQQDIESKLRTIFLEMLGPIGKIEFEDRKIEGLFEDNLFKYIDYLRKNRIITNSEEFKNKIRLIFEGEKVKKIEKHSDTLSEKDLFKFVKGGEK
jgi:signal transduction histidine kinase